MLQTSMTIQMVTKQDDVVAMLKNCTGDMFGSNLGWYAGYRDWGFPNSLNEVFNNALSIETVYSLKDKAVN
jgi:hypothetical protein